VLEAEEGNTREVGVREVQFHLQGRLDDREVAAADWAGYFAAAARKLEALRSKKRAPSKKPTQSKKRGPSKKRAKAKKPRRLVRASSTA
jgi:hypothetical protein